MSEIIYLPSGGAIPGIPGEHAPGRYEVDYEARTIVPAPDQPSPEAQEEQPLAGEEPVQ